MFFWLFVVLWGKSDHKAPLPLPSLVVYRNYVLGNGKGTGEHVDERGLHMDEHTMEAQSLPEQTKESAVSYYREGLNCAECVFLSFLDTHETDLPPDVIRLASGFGGGIGQTKHICGAITGALLALGSVKGRANPFKMETPRERSLQLRQEVYPLFAALKNEIEAHYGTVLCAELTRSHEDFDGKERKKSCQEIIGYCAQLAAEHAAAMKQETEAL